MAGGAACAVVVALAAGAAASSEPSKRAVRPPISYHRGLSAGVAHAAGVARGRNGRLGGSAAIADRRRSRVAYERLSANRATAIDLARLPSLDAPPRFGVRSEPGVHVERYVGANTAVVSLHQGAFLSAVHGHGNQRRNRVLLRSVLPLRSKAGSGRLAPVDLGLQTRAGAYALANPLVNLAIGRELGASALRFADIGVGVTSVGFTHVRARPVAGKLLYANALKRKDTDFVISPVPTGADTSYVLRSVASPERLVERFSLPPSATLRPAIAAQPNGSGSLSGPIVIARGRSILATVLPPVAVDAQGSRVPLSYSLIGNDLVMRVRHAEGSFAYPILVDPYINEDQRYWDSNTGQPDPYGTPDFNGWHYVGYPTGYIPGYEGNLGSLGTLPSIYGPVSFANGLNLATYPNYTPPAGAFGEWYLQAPGSGPEAAHIFKADFGITANVPAYEYAYNAANLTCQEEGIFNSSGAPEAGLVYRGPTVTSSYAAGVFATCGLDYTPPFFDYKVFCLSVCGLDGGDSAQGTAGNLAALALVAPYGVKLDTQGYVYMGSSIILESDKFPPHIDTSQVPSGWTNDAPVTVGATDYGVGTYSVSASAPNWTGASTGPPPSCYVNNGSSNNGSQGGTQGSPNTGDRNHRCPTGVPLPLSFSTSSIPEGSYNVNVNASDVVGNTAASSVPVKVEHTAPGVAISGRLHDALGSLLTGDASLSVDATDPLSGVRSIEIDVDGVQQSFTTQPSSPCDACGLSADYMFPSTTYATGPHTVTVKTTNYTGLVATAQWSVVVNSKLSQALACTPPGASVNFPLFDAGILVDGLLRSTIVRDCEAPDPVEVAQGYKPTNSLTFEYGSCDANATDPATQDSGCAVPVEVQVWPACQRNQAEYDMDPEGTPPPHQDLTVRGAPASFFNDDSPPRLEVYTGTSTIVISGPDQQTELDFANSLVPVDPNPWQNPNLLPSVPALLGPLPPPVDGMLTGLLGC